MKILRLLALIIVMFVSGCEWRYLTVANGPTFFEASPPSDQNGLLYMYHDEVEYEFEPSHAASIDDKVFYTLAKNGYSFAYLSPGIHKISITSHRDGTLVTELAITPSQTIFIKFQYTFTGDRVLKLVNNNKPLMR